MEFDYDKIKLFMTAILDFKMTVITFFIFVIALLLDHIENLFLRAKPTLSVFFPCRQHTFLLLYLGSHLAKKMATKIAIKCVGLYGLILDSKHTYLGTWNLIMTK